MSDLTIHKKFHLIDLPFKCHLCIMAFGSASELASHQQLHSSILNNGINHDRDVSQTTEQASQASDQPHQELTDDQPARVATGLKMAQLSLAKDHNAHTANDKPVNGKLPNGEAELDIEKLMKIVNKPFKCSECGKAFVSTTELAGHVRMHTGERPFKCSLCDNCYRTQSTLSVHMKSHEKEKCFPCSYCKVTCPTLSKLYDHFLIHQPVSIAGSRQASGSLLLVLS